MIDTIGKSILIGTFEYTARAGSHPLAQTATITEGWFDISLD